MFLSVATAAGVCLPASPLAAGVSAASSPGRGPTHAFNLPDSSATVGCVPGGYGSTEGSRDRTPPLLRLQVSIRTHSFHSLHPDRFPWARLP